MYCTQATYRLLIQHLFLGCTLCFECPFFPSFRYPKYLLFFKTHSVVFCSFPSSGSPLFPYVYHTLSSSACKLQGPALALYPYCLPGIWCPSVDADWVGSMSKWMNGRNQEQGWIVGWYPAQSCLPSVCLSWHFRVTEKSPGSLWGSVFAAVGISDFVLRTQKLPSGRNQF